MRFSIIAVTTAFLTLAQLGSAVSTTDHKGDIAGYEGGFGSSVTHHASPHQRSSSHHERTGALQRQLEERDVEGLYLHPRAPPFIPPRYRGNVPDQQPPPSPPRPLPPSPPARPFPPPPPDFYDRAMAPIQKKMPRKKRKYKKFTQHPNSSSRR
ncbi:hypothetical protein AX17_007172 [Amanita inopinata Kibby_2008]|nr:hypothetical protein AX17_007172 [Amanita inopinata Kibby_2008]